MGGYTLVVGGTGGAGGATLGGVSGKIILGSLCGVGTPWSNLSSGGSIGTGGNRGG